MPWGIARKDFLPRCAVSIMSPRRSTFSIRGKKCTSFFGKESTFSKRGQTQIVLTHIAFFWPLNGTARTALGFFISSARKAGVDQLRISGGEPTLGKPHLLGLLERVESSPFRLFILETNGMLIGADPDYAQQIARFKKVHTRVSLKAGTPEAFTTKTGARPESFELPFRGIVNLMKSGASFHVAAMSADPRIVTKQERQSILDRLGSIHLALVSNLEEEVVDPYHTTLERLRYADINIAWSEGRTR